MSLRSVIERMRREMSAEIPAETLALMRKTTGALVDSGLAAGALKAGDQAPMFVLPDMHGRQVDLRGLLDAGPVVLSFYRGGWCPFCNLELRALAQALPNIEAAGGRLVAVSPELPDYGRGTAEADDIRFKVLSDAGNRVARKFGLVFTLPESLRPVYAGFGIDLSAHNGDDTFELPMPATYIISGDGRIRHAFVSADYTERMEPDDIIHVLRELQADTPQHTAS